MSSSAFVAGPLFALQPKWGPCESKEEILEVVDSLKHCLESIDHSQEYLYRKDPWVVLALHFIQIQLDLWEEDIDGDLFLKEISIVQKCYEVLTQRVSDFATAYNKAKKKFTNEPKGTAEILMEGVQLGDDLLSDRLTLEGRKGGLTADKLVEFAQSEFGVYNVPDATLARTKDQPETQQYCEVRDDMSARVAADEPDAAEVTLGLIELKHAYTLYKQMVKRHAPSVPAPAAPSPVSPVKPSSSKKKKEESDDEMEVEEVKKPKKKVEKKKRPVSDDEEEEEEKPKAKKPKAESAPPLFSFGAPAPKAKQPIAGPPASFAFGAPAPVATGFAFKRPLPVATMAEAATLLSGAGAEFLVSKTHQLLKKDAQPMVDMMAALQQVLQPATLQAIANKDNRVFVELLDKVTKAIQKC